MLLKICTEETIIIGHGLHHDLKALKFEHFNVIDTTYLYLVENAPKSLAGARDICEQVLGVKVGVIHDPVEDARIALYIAAKLLVFGPNKPIKRGEKKLNKELRMRQLSGDFKGFKTNKWEKKGRSNNKSSGNELLVHRVPEYCTADQIRSMIVSHTNCNPMDVSYRDIVPICIVMFIAFCLLYDSGSPSESPRRSQCEGGGGSHLCHLRIGSCCK